MVGDTLSRTQTVTVAAIEAAIFTLVQDREIVDASHALIRRKQEIADQGALDSKSRFLCMFGQSRKLHTSFDKQPGTGPAEAARILALQTLKSAHGAHALMHPLFTGMTVLATSLAAAAAHGSERDNQADLQQCRVRQVELNRKAVEFKGEPMMKRLIEADLRRASKEEAEGDGDECIEALDHAAKLLAGDA